MECRDLIKGNTPVTDAQGRATTEREMARRSRIRGIPTTVFYAPDGKELARYVGPPRNAAEYLLLARYVIDGEYAGKTFRQFRQGAK